MTPDSWGVWVGDKLTESCVAVCLRPEGIRKAVRSYQELHRGTVPIKVEREMRESDAALTPCGYCGRAHRSWCVTDHQGNPSPALVPDVNRGDAFEDGE